MSGNRGFATTSVVPCSVREVHAVNCYGVATPVAEPGKTQQNPAKSVDLVGGG